MSNYNIFDIRYGLLILFLVCIPISGSSQTLEKKKSEQIQEKINPFTSEKGAKLYKNENSKNPGNSSILDWEELSGNWWGYRDALRQDGLNFNVTYTSDFFGILNGDRNEGFDYVDNVDLQLTLNFDKLFNWRGARLFVYGLGDRGGGICQRSKSAQGISNIEAVSTWKFYQVWIEQKLFKNRLSLLFGLYDLNSEFDTRETSSIFINPSQGIGIDFSQSGKNGPSIFPTASLAFRISYKLFDGITLHSAIFDGVPGDPDNPYGTHIILRKSDGFLLANEIDFNCGNGNLMKGYGKYALGAWYYTSQFPDVNELDNFNKSIQRNGNYGVYAFGEKFIYAEDHNTDQGASIFLRVGIADKNVNEFDSYLGGGIVYKGLITGRDADIIGLAFASCHTGNKYRASVFREGNTAPTFETDIELTYNLKLTNYLELQPDLQYIINPINSEKGSNTTAFGIRSSVEF